MTRIPALRSGGSRPAVPAVALSADVVVVGGGPAVTWAALGAAESGADVVLADKGYCGTSGPTASGGTGVWYVEPGPAAREAAMASREGLGGYLADRGWMARVLDPGGGPPVIARQADCRTCFMCEAYCPADALFVALHGCPLPTSSPLRDEAYVTSTGLLGS
jgi:NAD-dependent dihydropyrimidine dehydrogenase PreA subunit